MPLPPDLYVEEWLPAGLITTVLLAPVYIQTSADSPLDERTIRSAPPPQRDSTNRQGTPAAPPCCRSQSARRCRCSRQYGWLLGAMSGTLTIPGPYVHTMFRLAARYPIQH